MTGDRKVTPAHDQHQTASYDAHYPDHAPREGDPHYHLFNAYHRKHRATARCWVGERIGFEHCAPPPLELHHAHLEFAVQNAATWEAVAKDYPAVTDVESLDAWVESEPNFRWLCAHHHRSPQAGAHHVSHSDWEAGAYSATFLTQYDDIHRLIEASGKE